MAVDILSLANIGSKYERMKPMNTELKMPSPMDAATIAIFDEMHGRGERRGWHGKNVWEKELVRHEGYIQDGGRRGYGQGNGREGYIQDGGRGGHFSIVLASPLEIILSLSENEKIAATRTAPTAIESLINEKRHDLSENEKSAATKTAPAAIEALINEKRHELKAELAGIMHYPAPERKARLERAKLQKNQEIFAELANMNLLTPEQSDRITSGALKDYVYTIVNSIPGGFVLPYGAIAAFAGVPNHARLVGRIMSMAPDSVNAHRVVSSKGATAPHWDGQRGLLEREGVAFLPDGRVDMKKHLWRGYGAQAPAL